MATPSSSTKRAAKLAKQGAGKKVRFQGGTVFPVAVAITLILGLALIVYARQSQPAADATPPQINDHWHMAYGFYLCDSWYTFQGALEERDSSGNLANRKYIRTSIHSHDDGVIHWHPYTTVATGKRAKLGIFLDNYDTRVEDNGIFFPDGAVLLDSAKNPVALPQTEWIEGETQCNGEDAEVSVVKWDYTTDLDSDGQRYISNVDQIHMDHDGMSFAIMFTPKSAGKIKPPSAGNLQELGAVDAAGGSQYTDPNDFVDDGAPVATLGGPSPDSAPDSSTAGSDAPDATPAPTVPGSAPVTTGG